MASNRNVNRKGIFEKIREIKNATETPSTSGIKRKRTYLDDSDDDNDHIIIIPDEEVRKIQLGFIFEKDARKQKWKTEMVQNLDISLLHCSTLILIEKELSDGSLKTLTMSVEDCRRLLAAREEILQVLQDLLDSNFDRVATASFGSGGVNQIKFKTFEGSNVVDIREYYISPAGEHKPSKNGVMFNAEFLCDVFDKIKHLLGFCNK